MGVNISQVLYQYPFYYVSLSNTKGTTNQQGDGCEYQPGAVPVSVWLEADHHLNVSNESLDPCELRGIGRIYDMRFRGREWEGEEDDFAIGIYDIAESMYIQVTIMLYV